MAQWLTAEQYGNGSDGVLGISGDTTEAPVDSSCSGAAAGTELTATNASFAANQIILIYQSRGTGVAEWELNVIASYTEGTITTKYDLANTYTDSGASQAQVRVLKQYSSVTVDSTKTYTAKAWDGDVGGILAFMCNGDVTIPGTILSSGKGFAGGVGSGGEGKGEQGEGTPGIGVRSNLANGNGGGGGGDTGADGPGGGGGNGDTGDAGTGGSNQGAGGAAVGAADLATMAFGGGGGEVHGNGAVFKAGGAGAGIVIIIASKVTVSGAITGTGVNGGVEGDHGSGAGAGSSILIKSNIIVIGTNKITALGGTGGQGSSSQGGDGSVGRIALHYGTSYTGSTNPTLDATKDNNLVLAIMKPVKYW